MGKGRAPPEPAGEEERARPEEEAPAVKAGPGSTGPGPDQELGCWPREIGETGGAAFRHSKCFTQKREE